MCAMNSKDHINEDDIVVETQLNGVTSNGTISTPDLHIERPVYSLEELHRASNYLQPKYSIKESFTERVKEYNCLSVLSSVIPVIKWLPEYNWRKDIVGDLISGVTVAIMHIPQGLAYGRLGNVPEIVGIYMAFFPVLVYFFFGTSRHVSMGTFAVICLMTGNVVAAQLEVTNYTPIQIATTVTFTVAIFQMLMYILRLGIVTNLLSETLVNGFTCASAFHVVASQVKDLFGLPTTRKRGMFSFVYTIYDAIMKVPEANRTAVSISMTAIVFMVINNEIFKPWLAQRTPIPFPIELVAVVIGTTTSYFMNLHVTHNVTIVGEIPTGLPRPELPAFELIPSIAMESLVITFISYSITISMAFIFSQKLHYEVDANQELFAMSVSNCFGSFFSSMPISASLSRSIMQQTVGGVTQIASLVSCLLLLFVLLWIGPIFESLPRCILASIIVVALKGMLLQFTKLKKFYQLSKWDAVVWVVTFLTTVLVSIDIGLLAGVCVSLLSIFIKGQVPYTCLLGVVPNTDLYLDCKRNKGAQEIDGIKIFHYSGALNFASRHAFKTQLIRKVGFDPAKVLAKRSRAPTSEDSTLLTRCVIVDLSAVTYVDPAGVDTLRTIAEGYKQLGVSFLLSNCSEPVYETFLRCDKYERNESRFRIYPTVHDAVLFSRHNMVNPKEA